MNLRTPPPAVIAIVAVTIVIISSAALLWDPLSASTSPLDHPAFVPILFDEHSVFLPNFAPLYDVVHGNNCVPHGAGCYVGGTNYSEVPVLSSDTGQPYGIYYVDNSSHLDEFALPDGPARMIAPVQLLYQGYSAYGGMLPNEFTIEYGTDDALFVGTPNPGATLLSLETVNLTTGVVHSVATLLPATPFNQQAMYLGHDLALVVSSGPNISCTDCAGTVYGVNTVTGATWVAAQLPFFEANNLYWLPQKQQLINVEAHGAKGDRIQQWDEQASLNGDVTFTLAQQIAVDRGIIVNWADGIAYNSEEDRIAYSAGGLGRSITYVLGYDARGLLTNRSEVRFLGEGLTMNIQRYVYTGSWMLAGFVNGTQLFFDPWTGAAVPTNVPFTDLPLFAVCDGGCFLGSYAPSYATLIDFHASVARNDPFWSVVVAVARN